MSGRGFGSVYMVGAIAATALSCYMVSLRVASERASLEGVENKIVLAQRDIRLLTTEIGTRGRLAQLERWNVRVIKLSAPSADQFVDGAFQLATLAKPETRSTVEAPVVLAAAPMPQAPREPVVTSDGGVATSPAPSRPLGEMMHIASYKKPEPSVSVRVPEPAKTPAKAPSVAPKSVAKGPGVVASRAAATKPVKTAMADPLSPLSAGASKAKSKPGATQKSAATAPKDSGAN